MARLHAGFFSSGPLRNFFLRMQRSVIRERLDAIVFQTVQHLQYAFLHGSVPIHYSCQAVRHTAIVEMRAIARPGVITTVDRCGQADYKLSTEVVRMIHGANGTE